MRQRSAAIVAAPDRACRRGAAERPERQMNPDQHDRGVASAAERQARDAQPARRGAGAASIAFVDPRGEMVPEQRRRVRSLDARNRRDVSEVRRTSA